MGSGEKCLRTPVGKWFGPGVAPRSSWPTEEPPEMNRGLAMTVGLVLPRMLFERFATARPAS
ncbi:hypothetical protein B0G74_7391 [Paraburkholderia sp. BL9I2N2]|nr:hypothetical protein B0G74_7391 [Paraburkholderia sp. BL9I2N2]